MGARGGGGADGWALAPRLIGPALLGLAFALAPIRRLIGRSGWAPAAVGLLMIVTLAGVGVSDSPDRFAVPPPRQALPGGGDAAGPEWPAWGGPNAGQRFPTPGQNTPANVGTRQGVG